jgi:hypothetical protein
MLAHVKREGGSKLPRRNFLHLAAGAAALPAIARFAWAQTYPTRPVRIIAATAPGGLPDIIARLIGPWLSGRSLTADARHYCAAHRTVALGAELNG